MKTRIKNDVKTELAHLLFLMTLTLGASKIAFAGTYYVSPGGNDNAAGTEAQPWASIQKAANTMKPGDTVLVKNGTYKALKISLSGTASSRITYKAYPGQAPVISYDGATGSGIIISGADYVVID